VLAELLKVAINIEVRNAKAELDLRHAELDEMKNGSLEEEKQQSAAQLEAARARWNYAKSRHSRVERLFQLGTATTQEEMDLSFSNLSAAEQEHIAAKAAYDLVKDWPRPEKLAQAQARYDAQTEIVNQLEDRLAKFTIRAPFDGYVTVKHTEVGAWINRGDLIAEVIELDPIEASVAVPETAIARLQEAMTAAEEIGGLEVAVKVDALGPIPFPGRVDRIVPQADVRSRTFPVKLLIDNPVDGKSHKLKAGMICHVSLPLGKPEKVTLVPKDAIVLGGAGPRVMVAEKGAELPVTKPVPVALGVSFGNFIEVSGGVKPGDLVVTRGNERLMPGQPLNIVKD
jgi:HlyD family secretion protein